MTEKQKVKICVILCGLYIIVSGIVLLILQLINTNESTKYCIITVLSSILTLASIVIVRKIERKKKHEN